MDPRTSIFVSIVIEKETERQVDKIKKHINCRELGKIFRKRLLFLQVTVHKLVTLLVEFYV